MIAAWFRLLGWFVIAWFAIEWFVSEFEGVYRGIELTKWTSYITFTREDCTERHRKGITMTLEHIGGVELIEEIEHPRKCSQNNYTTQRFPPNRRLYCEEMQVYEVLIVGTIHQTPASLIDFA